MQVQDIGIRKSTRKQRQKIDKSDIDAKKTLEAAANQAQFQEENHQKKIHQEGHY